MAYDDEPSAIRASLRNRDEIFQDDWIGIIVDPYGDAAQAYEIFVNPLGIQGDLLMSGSGGEDVGFDLVFQSEGRVTEQGYQVEMAIPFSSLRFPDRDVQAWNLTFVRTRPRSSREQYSWSTVNRDDPCFMCQLGTMTGLEGVEPSTNLDILPALVGSQSGSLAGGPGSSFDNSRVSAQPSLNVRYNFTPSVSAEATVNPDFSQVESDAARIDVNSTFALFFPERRPFFQEGSDLFDTWMNVVYTRSINNPIAATKLTGRAGRTSFAYLGAMDEDTPLLLPFKERSAIAEAGQSFSNILRARHTFGENSFVGATLTDRRLFSGGYGSLGSLDMKLQFLTNYRLEAQVALSESGEPTNLAVNPTNDDATFADGAYTAALDGETYRGSGVFMSVDRNARHWNFDLAYEGYSPTFRTANGFVTGNDYRRLRMWQGVTFYPAWGPLERIRPMIFARTEYDFGGTHQGRYGQAALWMRLKGQTNVFMSYGHERERFRGVMFEGMPQWRLNVNSQFSDVLSGGFFVGGGQSIYRAATPEKGRQLNVNAELTVKPFQRLAIQPEINYSELRDLETGDAFFSGYVARAKFSIQFTRALSLRLITQYNDFNESVDIEPLLKYQLNPFTKFFVGSTHDYNHFEQPYGLTQAQRQFFFKLQYLFRV